MRMFLMACLVACMFVNMAEARLGETEKKCDARYGVALSEERGEQKITKEYRMDDFKVQIVFARVRRKIFRDRYLAAALNISRPGAPGQPNAELDQREIEEVLRANSGRSRWEEVNPTIEAARRTNIEEQSRILSEARFVTRWVRKDDAKASYDRRTNELVLRCQVGPPQKREAQSGEHGF